MDKSTVGRTSGSSNVHHSSNLPASSGKLKVTGSSVASNNVDSAPSSVELNKNRAAVGSRDVPTEQKSIDYLPLPCSSSPEVRITSSYPKSEQTEHEQHVEESKFHEISCGAGKTTVHDTYVSRLASSHSNSTGSRPSSNYSNRSHHTVGPQRGTGSIKEWKPKPVNHNTTQGFGASSTGEVLAVSTEASEKSVENVIPSTEATFRLEKQIQDLQIKRQHVIIPNHILVSKAERTKLSFGSFDAGFSITSSSAAFLEKKSAPLSHHSQEVEESFEEEEFRHPTTHLTEKEEDSNVYSESPSQVPDNMAGEGITATNAALEYDVSKQENMLESGSNQNSFYHVCSSSSWEPASTSTI